MHLGADHDAASALKCIGVDAYKAAGGEIVEDLFGDSHVIADPDLAKRLLSDALQAECDRLVADGWSFAHPKASIQNSWTWPALDVAEEGSTEEERDKIAQFDEALYALSERYDAGEIDEDAYATEADKIEAERDALLDEIEARGIPADVKATAGCLVEPSCDGGGFTVRAVRRPHVAEKASTADHHHDDADDQGAKPEKPAISAALALSLSQQLTAAAARTLAQDDVLALRMAVAALEASDPYNSSLKLRANGMPDAIPEEHGRRTYADVLTDLAKKSRDVVIVRLVVAIARSLDLRTQSPESLRSTTTNALLAALHEPDFTDNMRAVFDAQGYFERITGAQRDAALEEMGVVKKDRPKKKAEAVALCKSRAIATGWLPRELRHPSTMAEGDAT